MRQIPLFLLACLATTPAWAAHNDGAFTGMSFTSPSTVMEGGTFGLQISGSKHCALILHYDSIGSGNVHLQRDLPIWDKNLPQTVQLGTTGLDHFWADTSNSGKLPPGTYRLTLEPRLLYGNAPCSGNAAPLQLTVTAAPKPTDTSLSNLAVYVMTQTPGAPSPYPPGTPLFYALMTSYYYGKCMVDASLSGPESFYQPGQVMELAGKKNFAVTKPGRYTLTLATSPNAPIDQKCKGGPIAKVFDIVDPQAFAEAWKKSHPIMIPPPKQVVIPGGNNVTIEGYKP